MRLRGLADRVEQVGVAPGVLAGEPRLAAPEVALGQLARRVLEGAGEEAPAERGVRHDGDAQFGRRPHRGQLHVPAEQRPLRLERGDRVHGVRLAQFGAGHLGQAQVAHLAGGDQFGHGADGLAQRHARVAAVHVVQVDDVNAQPPQAGVDRLPDVGGVVADRPVRRVVLPALDGELRREGDLVAVRLDEGGEELLVAAEAVHVRGVEQGHAQIERDLQGLAGGGLVGVAVELAHAHAAQALDADQGSAGAEVLGGQGAAAHHAVLSGARAPA